MSPVSPSSMWYSNKVVGSIPWSPSVFDTLWAMWDMQICIEYVLYYIVLYYIVLYCIILYYVYIEYIEYIYIYWYILIYIYNYLLHIYIIYNDECVYRFGIMSQYISSTPEGQFEAVRTWGAGVGHKPFGQTRPTTGSGENAGHNLKEPSIWPWYPTDGAISLNPYITATKTCHFSDQMGDAINQHGQIWISIYQPTDMGALSTGNMGVQ